MPSSCGKKHNQVNVFLDSVTPTLNSLLTAGTLTNVWDKLHCTVMMDLHLASQVMHCAFPRMCAIILNDGNSGSAYCCSKGVMYFH
jgi:hypothetical protein